MEHTILTGRIRRLLTALALTAACAAPALLPPAAQAVGAQQPADARPRRVQGAAAPQATPAPVPSRQAAPQQPSPSRPTLAQPSPTATPPADGAPQLRDPKQEGQEVGDDEVVRVETNEIKLHVRVIDRNNRPVGDVRQEQFRVFENGQPQTITWATKEEVPITYALVVDNSGSMRSQLPKVIESGKTIVNSNKPGDDTMVVRFVDSDKIETIQDFTSSRNDLLDALETLYTEGGQTAVMDAVYLTAERLSQHKKADPLDDRRRRALVLVTDGEDRASFYKQDQLFAALREMDVQIYVIGFVNELDKEGGIIKKSPREKAVKLINRLATETGGRAFFPNSLSELPQIAQEITRDLRTQYVIAYKPTEQARPGEFRAVKVAVDDGPNREKRIALTRAGYTGKGAAGGTSTTPPARIGGSASAQRP